MNMLDFFSKAMQRKLKIVQLLNSSPNYIELGKISKHLNSTERIIQEDIKELMTSEMGHIFEIEIRSKEYKIRLRKNASIDAFGHYLMKNNIYFRILEYTFFNNNCTIEDLADIHHTSLPTLYRIARRINNEFKGIYNLQFQTNPCRIVGDEIEVRSFYIQYFAERYPLNDWPFNEINQEKLLNMFTEFTNKLNYKLQFSDLRTIELSLAISHTRCNQGYPLNKEMPRLKAILDMLHTTDDFHLIFNEIFQGKGNTGEFDDCLAYIVTEYFFFNYEEFLKSASLNEYSARSFIHLSGMVNDLSTKYNIPLSNKETLIYNIHNSSQLGIRDINVRTILIDNKYILLKNFKDLFPNFYNDMESKMMQYLEVMELEHKDALLKNSLHNFVTRWEHLLKNLYLTQRKINIRVVSSHDVYHARLMMMLLKQEFHEQIDVSLIDTIDINQSLSNNKEIDILVTNFTLPITSRQVIAVNDIPGRDDFNIINKVIRDIRMQENKLE